MCELSRKCFSPEPGTQEEFTALSTTALTISITGCGYNPSVIILIPNDAIMIISLALASLTGSVVVAGPKKYPLHQTERI